MPPYQGGRRAEADGRPGIMGAEGRPGPFYAEAPSPVKADEGRAGIDRLFAA